MGLLGKDDIFTLAGYDMYHVMSRLAAKKREVRYYGKESSSYFVRIFTLKELIKNNADRLQEFAPLPTPSAKPKSKLIPPPNPVPKSRIMP